ncbi:MAG: S9 family peptidase [Thermoanaerobaculia bacterium]
MTPEDVDASQPRFSPDGRFLAWVESGEDSASLRVAPARVGRATTVIKLDDAPGDFAWSPDGEQFVMERFDDAPDGQSEDSPWVITRSLIRRDGEGFLDGRHTHLWRVDRRSGKTKQLTSGAWDDSSPAWSPDGQRIAFVSNRAADPDATDNTDIYLVPAAGGDATVLVDLPGGDDKPSWSHRGDRIAFHSVRRANDYYQPQRLMTIAVPATAGVAPAPPVDLTGSLDAWIASDCMQGGSDAAPPLWSPDDATLLTLFENRGATRLDIIDAISGAARTIGGERRVQGLVRELPNGKGLIYSETDPTHPPELYRATGSPASPERLTHLYDEWLAKRRLVTPEKIVARNSSGDNVEAWLYPALDPVPGTKVPLVVYIHGGPQGFDGDFFDFDLENQLFPAHGWAVLRVNYRGSTSYGEKFSRAIWGDWQSREYEDLMAALDGAIAGHSWIDADRLGIGGWSYGGIMTLWTVGHTQRFKVGVPERFSFDYLSSFGEDQWYVWMLSELGSPLDNEELYRRLSPGTYIRNITTPIYLIANERDYNCPMTQAMQLYERLHLLGKKTELVVYPGESHSMSMPSHYADRLERLLVWFGRHLDR